MGDSKRELIYRRVTARLKVTNIASFKDYLDFLKKGDPSEVEAFSNAVTTNLTSFFREGHHFDFLAKNIIPEIVARPRNDAKRLRIWSAGCSTGEEPYSIAITLKETLKNIDSWDAKILCTDIDSNVLKTCKSGIYSQQRVENIPQEQVRRWFRKSRAEDGDLVKVSQELQDLVVFKKLNLMLDWPMKGCFDAIFCRNVIIYFDKPTQRVLIERFANLLADGGYLILGHSESLFSVSDRFSLLGQTIYRKTA
jgi:chemotaxis protein methyltransferase CheR